MLELDLARERIRCNPDGDAERVLRQVILALESRALIDLGAIYELDVDTFNLVIDILRRWWLQRYSGAVRGGTSAAHAGAERRARLD